MSTDSTAAARYARGLFIVAERKRAVVPTLADLKAVIATLDSDHRIGRFFRSPLVRPDDKRRLLRSALEGRVQPHVIAYVDLMVSKKRQSIFRDSVREFEKLVEEQQGIVRAEVVSAVALTGDEEKRLHAQLERMTGKTIRLTPRVAPELVGGCYVRIGNRVLDRSVTTLLSAIAKQLYEVSV